VRDEKVKVLHCIPPLRLEDVVLGQYVADDTGENPGYLEDPTVPEGSVAPTYAMARFAVNNARWAGVPFVMKAGKALNERKCEIRIQFKEPPGSASMFAGNKVPLNELVIRVQPNDAIYFKCNVKTPGFRTIPVETDMDLTYTDKFEKLEVPDAYTRLILDVLRGEQATFVRSDELEAAWSIFTPLLHQIEGERIKPIPYKFGSRGPAEADAMMEAYYERSTNYVWQGRQYGSSVSSL
jgi:glucose-6-phosphate 1-dehydrogenase